MHKLEDKVFFMYQNQIHQGIIIEILQSRYGFIYRVEFYSSISKIIDPPLQNIQLDGESIFTTLYKLLENLEDDFYLKMGELSKNE
jgi:hypothetical protein